MQIIALSLSLYHSQQPAISDEPLFGDLQNYPLSTASNANPEIETSDKGYWKYGPFPNCPSVGIRNRWLQRNANAIILSNRDIISPRYSPQMTGFCVPSAYRCFARDKELVEIYYDIYKQCAGLRRWHQERFIGCSELFARLCVASNKPYLHQSASLTISVVGTSSVKEECSEAYKNIEDEFILNNRYGIGARICMAVLRA